MGIFSFFSLIENLSDHNSLSAVLVFSMTLLDLPGLAFDLMPIAALVGTLLALGGLMEKNELVVVRMAGGAKLYIFAIVLKSASVLVVFAILLGEIFAPIGQNLAANMTSSIPNFETQNERIWAKEDNAFISVGGMPSECRLIDIKILKFTNDGALNESIFAKNGNCIKNGWELNGVEKTFFERDARRIEHTELLIWKTDLDSNLFGMLGLDPEKLGLVDLWTYVNYAKQNAQHSQKWAQAFWFRLIHPFTIYCMVFLAFPAVLMTSRSTGLGRVVFVGICAGLAFYVFNRLSSSFGIAFEFNPIFSSLSPSLLILVIGTWLNIRAR
jgi:lipopolysaccharide export system permease protein